MVKRLVSMHNLVRGGLIVVLWDKNRSFESTRDGREAGEDRVSQEAGDEVEKVKVEERWRR